MGHCGGTGGKEPKRSSEKLRGQTETKNADRPNVTKEVANYSSMKIQYKLQEIKQTDYGADTTENENFTWANISTEYN